MNVMGNNEKAELLKDTITHLYSKEGRTKAYISRLLNIERTALTKKIKEWNLLEAEPRRHLTPSNQKFLNKHKNLIKSRLDNDIPITSIAKELGVTRYYLQRTIMPADEVLTKSREDYINRMHTGANLYIEKLMEKSSLNYQIVDYDDEIWKDIKGYPLYMVSNYGRVKKYISSYKSYRLLSASPNKNNGRLYVMLQKDSHGHNLQVARLVAHSFVSGYSNNCNTVNHKDGNVQNNTWTNLEWMSQSDNNRHSYRTLNRPANNKKRYQFKKIVYKEKYEFKTIAAFAKFIHKSETQTHRYLDFPEKHDIKLIK